MFMLIDAKSSSTTVTSRILVLRGSAFHSSVLAVSHPGHPHGDVKRQAHLWRCRR